MKAVIDPTAQYLILSDINCRLVYVLNILLSENKAEVVTVSEFASPSPILTLSCLSAGPKTVVQTSEGTEVLSEEVILKWYKDGHIPKGWTVFMEQMKKFIDWLEQAESGKCPPIHP